MTVPDLHQYDAEPPTSTVLELHVKAVFDKPPGDYAALFESALAEQYRTGVVEIRHATSYGLGAQGVWDVLVGFVQSVPVEELAKQGGMIVANAAAGAAAKEIAGRLLARLAGAGVHLPAPPHVTNPPPVNTPPDSLESAQISAQEYLRRLRYDPAGGGRSRPDDLLDAKREDDGTCVFVYRRRDNGQRVKVAVLAHGVVARYTVEEEAPGDRPAG